MNGEGITVNDSGIDGIFCLIFPDILATGTFEEFACESISTRSVFLRLRANPEAREMAVLVFPTPPFCEAIEIIIVSCAGSLVTGFSVKLYNLV